MSETQTPSPWHFNVHDMRGAIPRERAEGIHADVVSSPNVMISVVRVAPNATSTSHSHPEEQWGVLLEGSCTRFQGSEAVDMRVGDFWCTPGGVVHNITAGPQGTLTFEIFCPPRSAYLAPGEGFSEGKDKP